MNETPQLEEQSPKEEKPFLNVLVHSFFVIPFLIAVFCLLLFAAMHLLTREKRSAYDYLNDVKMGGMTKRWQAAFELSKLLSNSKTVVHDEKFINQMISVYNDSKEDDPRVRQYLALAMGRAGEEKYLPTLLGSLPEEKEENLPSLIYAIGMIKNQDSAEKLFPFMEHQNSRIRSITAVALGNIGNLNSQNYLKKALNDQEPNVEWGSAISLAKLGDASGVTTILNLLDRSYLEKFPEVDSDEQTNLMLSAIDAAQNIKTDQVTAVIKNLSATDKNMNVRQAAFNYLK
jgi:HEAT repeat protein